MFDSIDCFQDPRSVDGANLVSKAVLLDRTSRGQIRVSNEHVIAQAVKVDFATLQYCFTASRESRHNAQFARAGSLSRYA